MVNEIKAAKKLWPLSGALTGFIVKNEVIIQEKVTENSSREKKRDCLMILLVLIVTAIVFSGSLTLDWTNWDDDLLIYENPLVKEGTLKDIFTKPADYNTYNPLVIVSFALEWKVVKDKPFLYHLDNLLLHLLCTLLVLLFFRGMGLSIWWSGFAALLFGIHPLRVESVAWVTERKDLLYGLFYLAALLTYIRYIVSGKNIQLLLVFTFFVFSLFSKAQAVTLPLVMVLLDWYFKRKISWKAITEKGVFFAVSLVIGLLGSTFFLKNVYITTNSRAIVNAFSFFEQIMLGGYTYTVYVLKSVIPYATSALYPLPTALHWEHWTGAAVAVVIFISALAVWRKYRFVTFGLLFFTFNIFLLLMPFLANESAFLNDHYTYIAYAGLFFIIAMGLQKLSEKTQYRIIATGFAIVLLIAFCALTVKYIPVWKNSETLWTDVIEKYPRKIAVAYLNRGHYFYKDNQSDKALDDFNTAIEVDPEYPLAYLDRSSVYLDRNDIDKVLQDYNRYLSFLPPFYIKGNVPHPLVSDVLGNRGVLYSKKGLYEKALADFDLAITLKPLNPTNYLNRAYAYYNLRRIAEAKQDVLTAEKMGATVDPSFEKLLKLR
jgi:tetratricopeptide (TPR) repeat protein